MRLDRELELAIIRHAYAKQIMAVMGTEDARYLHWGMSIGR